MSESDPSALESSATTEQLTISEASSSSRRQETLSTAEWQRISAARREIDGHMCANCGNAERQLTVHHIVPDTMGGTTQLSNLITLCNVCHDNTHIDDETFGSRTLTSKESPYIPMVRTMREIIETIGHPLTRAVWVLLAKTGMRVDEVAELDMSQLHLPNNPAGYHGIGPRREQQPNHIRLMQKNIEGVPGARGSRLVDVNIPLDAETCRVLCDYLKIRPQPCPDVDGAPVFLHTTRGWGKPLTGQTIHHQVGRAAKEAGYYETGGGRMENVTPITLGQFFEERFGGQPSTKDYIMGNRDSLPMRFDRMATDYREGVPRLLE